MPITAATTAAEAVAYFEANYPGELSCRQAVGCLTQIRAAVHPMQKAKALLSACRQKPTELPAKSRTQVSKKPEVLDPWLWTPEILPLAEALAQPMCVVSKVMIEDAWLLEHRKPLPDRLQYQLGVALEVDSERQWAKVIKRRSRLPPGRRL